MKTITNFLTETRDPNLHKDMSEVGIPLSSGHKYSQNKITNTDPEFYHKVVHAILNKHGYKEIGNHDKGNWVHRTYEHPTHKNRAILQAGGDSATGFLRIKHPSGK